MKTILGIINGQMSNQMHNYVALSLLCLTWACAISVLIWPNPTRLSLAGDVLFALCGSVGINATAHTIKTVRGVEEGGPKADGA